MLQENRRTSSGPRRGSHFNIAIHFENDIKLFSKIPMLQCTGCDVTVNNVIQASDLVLGPF